MVAAIISVSAKLTYYCTFKTIPLPSWMLDWKLLSILEAATVMIHGAVLTTENGSGPSFPPEQMTKTPLWLAWKAPTDIGSLRKSAWKIELIPMDIEITSTPSFTASSIAFRTAELAHPPREHALYMAIRLDGEPPLAIPINLPI